MAMDSFFQGAKPAQDGGKHTCFFKKKMFVKKNILEFKNAKPNTQDDKSAIVKTKVEHIICKLHWCGKKRISPKIAEYIGIHGCSWVFMGVHGCSPVFMCFCWVVCLFV
jgi:hypothetical protein